MRITEEYTNLPVDLIEIKSANYIGDFAIRLFFSDGFNRMVDFKPFLESSLHPSVRKYLDETQFIQFKIIDGNLNWNDYDMIFPVGDLHEGKI
ncbi:MAG: DUF2442 domain-containing protein [Lentimicrobiaceae bacterium]|jgi:hypothetical protein